MHLALALALPPREFENGVERMQLQTIARASDNLLKCLLAVLCAAFVVVYLVNAAKRVPYPFELEWMEGGVVCHVQRVLEAKPLYGEPTADFVPFIYTPFYYYVAALPARLMGLGFTPLRLLSLLSSLGCAAMIVLIAVQRYATTRFFGFVAACFFLASFCVTGCWLDIARVDSLFLFLLLSAIYLFQSPRPLLHSVAAALVMFLAFFTKQTALFVAIPLCAWSLTFRKGWERIAFPLVFVSAVLLSTLIMDAMSGGWYSYYVFSLPQQHEVYRKMLWAFWAYDIFYYAAGALFVAALCFVKPKEATLSAWCLDAAIFGSLLLASWSSRLHSGGYLNVLLPAYAGLAIFFGVGLSRAADMLLDRRWLRLGVYAIALVQLQHLWYSPGLPVPREASAMAGQELLACIADIDGPVLIPSHPWYAAARGKPACAQTMAISDILRANGSSKLKQQLEADIRNRIARRDYAAIILDTKEFPGESRELSENYRLVKAGLTSPAFAPITGCAAHPYYLYLSNQERSPEAYSRIGSATAESAARQRTTR